MSACGKISASRTKKRKTCRSAAVQNNSDCAECPGNVPCSARAFIRSMQNNDAGADVAD